MAGGGLGAGWDKARPRGELRLEVVGRGGLAGVQDDEMQSSVQNFSCAPDAHVTRAPRRARELGRELVRDPGSGCGGGG